MENSRYPIYNIHNKAHALRAWAAGNVEQATELNLWFDAVRQKYLFEDDEDEEDDPPFIVSMKQASEVALIAPELEKLSCLHTLSIHCDCRYKFGSPALEKLTPSLAAFSSLRSLSIQVKLGNKGIRMLKTLFTTIGERLHLLNLESSMCRCSVSGASALSDVLPLLPELRELNISYNDIGPDSFAKISAALPKLPKLQKLNAEMNLIGNDGCLALAKAVEELPHLQNLDISANLISDAGVLELAEALRKLHGFKFLILCQNFINPDVIAKLVAASRGQKYAYIDVKVADTASSYGHRHRGRMQLLKLKLAEYKKMRRQIRREGREDHFRGVVKQVVHEPFNDIVVWSPMQSNAERWRARCAFAAYANVVGASGCRCSSPQ